MITMKMVVSFSLALATIFFLSLEKIRLSWEVSTLYNNSEILNVEFENLKI